ncbi:Glycosyl transferase, group 2 family protein [Vibrio coralliirubri]|uniref:glycosyltransferase family 2 protein n=1 Tax=Vibrio coralliirubri TaxID=1516159 RepID=UPI00062FE5B4|nr:glycosyltransferase family 2 protein [Vibrio coralliirubri]CDT39899.1 Glycosyl transferase, group 2 family protein [Vibrio coralliirubri]
MKVSIITVCYNSAETIEDTIKSVRSQTYKDIEYIVIDGGSSDETNQIIKRYSDFVDVHISEKDEGLYDAMNKGIKMASGDVIGILNSDDFFCSESSVADLMSGFSSENIDGVYSDLVYVEEKDTSKITRLYSSKVFKKSLIRFGLMLPHPTFYIKRKAYDKYGLYKTNYRVAADFEFITRCSAGGIALNRVPKITIKMREGGISSSGLMWRVHQNAEIVRACRENGIYTNLAMVALKLPYKILTLLSRKFVRV